MKLAVIKHYLRYTMQVFVMSFNTAAIHRIDFVMRILRAFIELGAAIVTIEAMFLHTSNIAGWTNYEVIMIYALARAVASTVMFPFGNGLDGLYRTIVNGTFDRMLLQPLDSQYLASTNFIYITNLFRLLFDWMFFTYAWHLLNIHPTLWRTALFIVGVIAAMVIYYAISFATATISFWSQNGDLFYFFQNIISVSRYPAEIFGKGLRLAITIIPIIFIAAIPISTLLRQPPLLSYFSWLIAIVMFILTRKLWHYALYTYNSASS